MTMNNWATYADRWTDEVAQKGIAAIPNCLLFCQAELGLKGEEAMVLICLLAYYWRRESSIYPATSTIAKSLGKSGSTIKRNIKNLEKKGFLARRFRTGTTNIYDITPTINKVSNHTYFCAWGKRVRPSPSSPVDSAPFPSMDTYEENRI
jgi:predicted transcriptional regulator